MSTIIRRVVQSCAVCATIKSLHCPPVGKLRPLLIPNIPWSHIAVDFVMDLPTSKVYTAILVVVDRFSKGCLFIPFRTYPTVIQVAEGLFQSVFCYYRLLEDILSDCGPQFITKIWKALFWRLGAMVSLT